MNLNNISQIRYGGKDIVLGKLNGDVIYEKTYIPVDPDGRKLIMTYTTANTSETHTFNSDFEYVSEIASNGDGTYTINLYANDDFTSFRCNKNTLTVDYLAITSKVTDMSNMFYNCNKLTSLDLSSWDTSNVTNMRDMFNNCTGLISLNLEGWDLRKANTQTMIGGCTSLTDLNVKNWKCGDLLGCFINCRSLEKLDLSGWDTSETTSMQQLFYGCSILKSTYSINALKTSKLTNMYGLFAHTSLGADAIIAFNSFDKSKVTNMGHIFEGCSFNTPVIIQETDTTNVTDMSYMFANTSNSSYMQIELDTSSVTDMSYMFSGCGATVSCYFHFNGDCSHMFENFTGSLNALWGGIPTNASYMFASSNIDDGTFSSYIYYIDLQSCQNTSYMFYNCQNIYNLSFSDSSYHNMYNLYESAYMFADCFGLNLIEIPYMSTSYLWNYENMFYNVPDYCEIKINRSLFCLDESSTGFSGYFQDY